MFRHLIAPLGSLALCAALALPVSAQSIAGPYLAARSAAMQNNFEEAADYFTQALARDPRNVELMDAALVAYLARAVQRQQQRGEVGGVGQVGDAQADFLGKQAAVCQQSTR